MRFRQTNWVSYWSHTAVQSWLATTLQLRQLMARDGNDAGRFELSNTLNEVTDPLCASLQQGGLDRSRHAFFFLQNVLHQLF